MASPLVSGASMWFSSLVSCIAGTAGPLPEGGIWMSAFGCLDAVYCIVLVVCVVGMLIAAFSEDTTPGSMRWWWFAMELLPMTVTQLSPHKKSHGKRISALVRHGMDTVGAETCNEALYDTGDNGPHDASPQTGEAETGTEAGPFFLADENEVGDSCDFVYSSGFNNTLSQRFPCCNFCMEALQQATDKIDNSPTTSTTDAASKDTTDDKSITLDQSSGNNTTTRVTGFKRAEFVSTSLSTIPSRQVSDTSLADEPMLCSNCKKSMITQVPVGPAAFTCASSSTNNTITASSLQLTNRQRTDEGPCTFPSSSLSTETRVLSTGTVSLPSQCCIPGCSSLCVHHHHQLHYYRSHLSAFARIHKTYCELRNGFKTFDSYSSIFKAITDTIKELIRRVQMLGSLMLLKYVVSKSKRQFFYMATKKCLGLPIKWKETEQSSYLTLKYSLKKTGQWPFMWQVNDLYGPDNCVNVEGVYAYPMSSYSYLDLIRHKDVQAYAIETARQWSTGTHGPRMLGGNSVFLRQLEKTIARFFGRDDCMVLSAGFLACMSGICAVCKPGDLIVADNRVHASLRAGLKLCGSKVLFFKHNDYDHLGALLNKHRKKYSDCWLVIESVYSMDGDTAKLPVCVELSKKYRFKIILDEAHGLGVLGATGRGLEEVYNMPGVCTLIVGTFSKSIATVGGYITGSQELVDFLDYHAPGNVFSAPLTAYCAGAALRSFQLIDEESWRVQRVQKNAHFLREALMSGLNFWPPNYPASDKYQIEGDPHTTVIPVVFKDSQVRVLNIASKLLQKGWIVSAVCFPACPLGGPRFRITATAAYTEEIMIRFVEALVKTTVDEPNNRYFAEKDN